MGVRMALAGAAAAFLAVRAWEIQHGYTTQQTPSPPTPGPMPTGVATGGTSSPISNSDKMWLMAAGALLGLGAQEMMALYERYGRACGLVVQQQQQQR